MNPTTTTDPSVEPIPQALEGLRVCDFTGQLAGAGATKWLAAFGAEVIRIEDPVRQGRWDILRGAEPFVDERRGIDLGGAFNNHNADKLGITLNLRTARGKQLLRELIATCDAVTENFAAGVLERLGFGYDALREIKPDIVYVSNCGFGQTGPFHQFKTWGPIVQAVAGLTYSSALPGQPPAGWGYSYMDHTGGYYMAMAILLALLHRKRTGEGQWVDLACTESALGLHGPALLNWTVNGASLADNPVDSNRSQYQQMAPHGIYPAQGEDQWLALACRTDHDWSALTELIDQPWCLDPALTHQAARSARSAELDQQIGAWTKGFDKHILVKQLRELPIAAAAVLTPAERIDEQPHTRQFGLWPEVQHSAMGKVRIDGQPVRMSSTPWRHERGAPCLGEHNRRIYCDLLGLNEADYQQLIEDAVI